MRTIEEYLKNRESVVCKRDDLKDIQITKIYKGIVSVENYGIFYRWVINNEVTLEAIEPVEVVGGIELYDHDGYYLIDTHSHQLATENQIAKLAMLGMIINTCFGWVGKETYKDLLEVYYPEELTPGHYTII